MTAPANLLWLDLETTGNNPETDLILEVGAVLTTSSLEELERYECVVHQSEAKRVLGASLPVIQEMHRASGLWDEAVNGPNLPTLSAVEADIVSIAKDWTPDDHALVLAGSGVGHFDLRFVQAQMPEVAALLAYYVIDVGVLRRALDMWGHADMLLKDPEKPHRALADAVLHLQEARHIRAALDGEVL